MFTIKPHILVVDDDDRLRRLLQQYLTQAGYAVSSAADTGQARHVLQSVQCDLMILDLMLPGESGLTFMEQLRHLSQVPVLMLSALGEPENRIAGLERGVEDYLPKPFEPKELLLRVGVILQRHAAQAEAMQHILFGPFHFDMQSGRLLKDGQPVSLTANEAVLLRQLVKADGAPLSREALHEAVKSGDNPRTIDVQINRLRRKIEEDPKQPYYIQTMRGAGYVFHRH